MSRLEWEAREYAYREKGGDWFWAVGIIAASLAITAVLFKNTIFAVLIILGAFTLMVFAKRIPRLVKFSVDEDGIRADKLFYPWSSLESYWVETGANEPPKLLVKSKRPLAPLIIIPLDDMEPDAVKTSLRDFLPLEKETEPLSQKIMEFLGF